MSITGVKNNNYADAQNCTMVGQREEVKAAKDEKTAQWLEHNLNLMPDVMDRLYEDIARRGARVISCDVLFDGYDCITTQVCTVVEADSGTEEAKKLVEEARARNKERREQQEKLLEKNKEKKQAEEKITEKYQKPEESTYTMKMVGNDLESISRQFTEKSLSVNTNGNIIEIAGFDMRA